MAFEIERKFLVSNPPIHHASKVEIITQGFLNASPEKVIRIRISDPIISEPKAFLTVKGKATGAKRVEIETEIDVDAARELLDSFTEGLLITKTRYSIPIDDVVWEIDKFHEPCHGLVVAEVELHSEDQHVVIPDWCTEEITTDFRYSNSSLCKSPWPFLTVNERLLKEASKLKW